MFTPSILEAGAAELRRGFEIVRQQFFSAIQNLPISVEKRVALRHLMTRPSGCRDLLACDFEARQKSGEFFIRAMTDYYETNAQSHAHTYMGTFAWDLGVSPLSEARVPLRALRKRTDKIMRQHGLHGVYFIELDIILRLPWEPGPRLHAHVHMWCWHPDRPLRPKLLGKTIRTAHHLPNDMGARSVVFTKRPLTAEGVVILGAYLTKVPACVKQRRKKRKGDGYRLTAEQAKYSPRMALRMIEILSQLSIYECVGGVGTGTVVTRAWRAGLYAFARDREAHFLRSRFKHDGLVTRRRAKRLWRRLRRGGHVRGQRVRIDR